MFILFVYTFCDKKRIFFSSLFTILSDLSSCFIFDSAILFNSGWNAKGDIQ